MRVVNLGPDPSLAYRPECHEKDQTEFRNFENGDLYDRVFNTYKLMHTYQTLDFVKKKDYVSYCEIQNEQEIVNALQSYFRAAHDTA